MGNISQRREEIRMALGFLDELLAGSRFLQPWTILNHI